MSSPVIRRYGWKPDLSVHPSCKLVRPPKSDTPLPPHVDNYLGFPMKPWDQGDLGSCTAHMAAALLTYDAKKQGVADIIMPARLMIYYNTRLLEGTPNEDSGASISDTVRSIDQFGACDESLWAYDTTKFTQRPPRQCYAAGLLHRGIKSTPVAQDEHTIKALLSEGFVIGFGFSVYDSFESDYVAKTGIVPWPKKTEKLLGGHATAICGYNDATRRYKVRNSWGTGWGDHGYFYLEYPFVHNASLASDFQCVEQVNG